MSNIAAIVKSLVGQVFLVSLDGLKRQIFEGERLLQGEQLLTGLGGEATLQLASGELISIGHSSRWQAGGPEADSDQTKAAVPAKELAQAVAAGFDPTTDLAAPAAGPGANGTGNGAAGGGHSFVMLDATAQQLDPTIGFATQGLGVIASEQIELDGLNSDGNQASNGASRPSAGTEAAPVNRAPNAAADSFTVNEDGGVIVDVRGNDSDPDGDTLVIVAVDGQAIAEGGSVLVSNGSVTLTNGQLLFTPDPDYNGPVSLTYTISDGALTSSATVTGTVSPASDAPIAVDDSLTASENTPITYTAAQLLGNDSDADGDSLTITSVTSGSGGTAVLNNDGTVTFTPTPNFSGSANFTYSISDGTGGVASATVTVTVVAGAPSVMAPEVLSLDEDSSISGNVLSNDTDPDSLLQIVAFELDGSSYSAGSTVPMAGIGDLVLLADGSYQFTPAADYHGPVPVITYTTNTGASSTLTLTVTPLNDAPVAGADSLSTAEDTPLVIDPDSLLGNDSDIDDDSLTIDSTQNVSNGSLSMVGGNLVFTPTPNYSGPASFDYTISDGNGGFDTVTVNIVVTPVADVPGLQLTGSRTVAATDFESAALNGASWSAAISSASLNNGLGGVWQTDNGSGQVEVGQQAVYLGGGSSNQVIELERNPGDASNLYTEITATAGSTYSVAFDYSPRNGSEADSAIQLFWGGNLVGTLNAATAGFNAYRYELPVPADGTYILEFRAVGSNSTGGLLDNIVLTDIRNSGGEDTAIRLSTIEAMLNDTDGSETLQLSLGDIPLGATLNDNDGNVFVASPANGNLVDISSWNLATLSILPPANFTGTFALSVTATATEGANGDQRSTSSVINVTVQPINDAPVANDETLAAVEDTPITFTASQLLDNDSDVDLDPLSIASVTSGTGGSAVLNGDGTVTFTPNSNFNGSADFTYTVTDGSLTSNSATATVNIGAVNDAPVAANDVLTPASIRSGLHADFYNYREGAVASGFDGPNMASIAQAQAFINSHAANAIFIASSLSFTPTLNHLGSGTQLENFLGADSDSLIEINRLSTIDAVVHLRGQITLAADTYNFRINADDGYIIRIDGVTVASLTGTNTNNTTTHASFTIASGGLHDIEIIYYDQGGFARFDARLQSSTGVYAPVTESMLSHSPALYGGVETYSFSAAELLANDSDADAGDTLSITGVSNALGGVVSLSADLSTITFVREAGFTGTPSFSYTMADASGASSSAQVQIAATTAPLAGTPAADILIGLGGDDLVLGLAGNDALTGNGGSDTFTWLKGHTGHDTISDFNLGNDTTARDRIDLRDLLAGENDGNITNYLQVVSSPTQTLLQISSTGTFNSGGSADASIALENAGSPVDLSSFGATSSAIVNALIAGADPLVKVDHA